RVATAVLAPPRLGAGSTTRREQVLCSQEQSYPQIVRWVVGAARAAPAALAPVPARALSRIRRPRGGGTGRAEWAAVGGPGVGGAGGAGGVAEGGGLFNLGTVQMQGPPTTLRQNVAAGGAGGTGGAGGDGIGGAGGNSVAGRKDNGGIGGRGDGAFGGPGGD